MATLVHTLRQWAQRRPTAAALQGGRVTIDYARLVYHMDGLAQQFVVRGYRVMGLLLDNCPAWAMIDLAAQQAKLALVPLPAFFTAGQLEHALNDAGIDVILTDQPQRFTELPGVQIKKCLPLHLADTELYELTLASPAARPLPAATAKITYTSGTTGNPKGVCLTQAALDQVTGSLLARIGAGKVQHHLSLMPLATLLENTGGVYLPLLAGGCCQLPPLRSVGMVGGAGLDPARMVRALGKHKAASTILVPHMLQAIIEAGAGKERPLPDLRFIAVGGAPVSIRLLQQARERDLPVYEGYGLSECASVVTVNAHRQRRVGSVGKPLAHARLRIADDGEILVAGSLFTAYLGAAGMPARKDGYLPTGDLGHLDEDGYLYVTGRKKNMFITAYGRNVAPEWIESELLLSPAIKQAAVFGEGRPWNTAVIVTQADRTAVDAAIAAANKTLPDYARVFAWLPADEAFCVDNGQLTGTGRPRRPAIWQAYGKRIDRLYQHDLPRECSV